MNILKDIIPSTDDKKRKVLIAVPTKDMLYAHFAYCLQELIAYNTKRQIETVVEFNMGTLVCNQREKLVEKAFEHNVTHILWLDSDMMFPKETCEILLRHGLDIVGCNYSTRSLPLKSVSYTELNNWDSGLDKDTTGLIEVQGMGLGCIMTKLYVFEDIDRPWFPITFSETTHDYLGEDMNFCLKAVDVGYSIMVDCDLSRQIYHIGSTAFQWNTLPVDNTEEVINNA